MEKINFAIESFKNIQDLIKFLDQKAGAILVVTGLIFTAYVDFLKDLVLVSSNSTTFFGVLTFVFSLITLISLTIVIYISIFKVLKPRKANHYNNNESSIFYFEHLLKLGKQQVLTNYQTISESEMLKNLIDQQHEISAILDRKEKEMTKSFNFLFISIISVILFILSSTQL